MLRHLRTLDRAFGVEMKRSSRVDGDEPKQFFQTPWRERFRMLGDFVAAPPEPLLVISCFSHSHSRCLYNSLNII